MSHLHVPRPYARKAARLVGDPTVAFRCALQHDATVDDLDAGHGARRGPGHIVHVIRMRKQRQVPGEAVVCLARGSQRRLIGDGRPVALLPVPAPNGLNRSSARCWAAARAPRGISRRCRRSQSCRGQGRAARVAGRKRTCPAGPRRCRANRGSACPASPSARRRARTCGPTDRAAPRSSRAPPARPCCERRCAPVDGSVATHCRPRRPAAVPRPSPIAASRRRTGSPRESPA